MESAEVLRHLSEHRAELASYGVATLAVFGSVARGQATTRSDIDLLVEFDRPIGLFEFVRLKRRLEAILMRRVDLATRSALKRQLRPAILSEAIRAF